MDLKSRVSLRIKTLRKLRKLSQEELADRIERSGDAVSAIERGKSLPSYQTLERLSKALDVSIRDLFDDGDERLSPERLQILTEAIGTLRAMDEKQLKLAAEMISSVAKSG